MTNRLTTIDALRDVIGKTPPAVNLKVIDHLDPSALQWLAIAPLGFFCLGGDNGVSVTVGGGEPGFARGEPGLLRLPLGMVDDPERFEPGQAFGSLFLAPGFGETLRVNGRVAQVSDGEAVIAVQECYLHCAKALIRSEFWSATPVEGAPDTLEQAVASSRFMALATADGRGGADLSPKGDPAGSLAQLDDDRLWFADRPGNRRVDSFRNIITQPCVAGVLLVPGSSQVVVYRGRAGLTADETARARFAVEGKVPRLAIEIRDLDVDLRASAALERAGLWPVGERADDVEPARIFASHVRLNKDKGLGARLTGAMVSIPGLMQKGLDKDYKDNLY